MADEEIVSIVNKVFDLRPGAIIRDLDLRRPIYKQVAAYGHFGRTDIDVPWERLDKVEEIKKTYISLNSVKRNGHDNMPFLYIFL